MVLLISLGHCLLYRYKSENWRLTDIRSGGLDINCSDTKNIMLLPGPVFTKLLKIVSFKCIKLKLKKNSFGFFQNYGDNVTSFAYMLKRSRHTC